MKQVSTTALSKILDISTKELFQKLSEFKLISKENDLWVLTEEGLVVKVS